MLLCVVVFFGYAAFYLYQKQKIQLTYLSFRLTEADQSFIVPDIDRLLGKLNSFDDLEMGLCPTPLKTAIDSACQHKDFSFNKEIAKGCFVSFNASDFTLVFNTVSSAFSVAKVLSDEFGLAISVEDEAISLGGVTLTSSQVGNYLAVSTKEISPKEDVQNLAYGNADYILFEKDAEFGVRHILSKKYHFKLWEVADNKFKGKEIQHTSYFNSAPSDFDELYFYGSNRMQEDVNVFFNEPSHESFDWINDGLLIIKKEDFEIVIAKQGDTRDLNIMLEEQTLSTQRDTAGLSFFNIGNFKIMPFNTTYNWKESIANLNSDLRYFTEYKNFNVMSNDIPAMRWYLGQIQLGNLIENDFSLLELYNDCLPEKAHHVAITIDSTGNYLCKSHIYSGEGKCLISSVNTIQNEVSTVGIEIVYDFEVNIVPTNLLALKQKGEQMILINNSNQISMYAYDGEKKWSLNLSSALVEAPQKVDFENDGIYEFVLFQTNQVDVVNSQGHSLKGFPHVLGANSTAGLAVNYDNLYQYRLIVNTGNTVKILSEEGNVVDGWMFNGMTSGMKGKIYHVLTKGKDIITFKDQSNIQYVLNRRGESRMSNPQNFKLPSETDFIVGSLESALRKMGYQNGYIYNYYILDGLKDSLEIDQKVNPIKVYWEFNQGKPLLILEETDRLLIVNEFGYVQSEVLKPNQSNQFVGLVGQQEYGFVFADNHQNSIYLLNNFGKMILPQAVEGSATSIIDNGMLFTFSGLRIKAYKITD